MPCTAFHLTGCPHGEEGCLVASHHFFNLAMRWRNLQHPLVTQPRRVGTGQHSLPSFPSFPHSCLQHIPGSHPSPPKGGRENPC